MTHWKRSLSTIKIKPSSESLAFIQSEVSLALPPIVLLVSDWYGCNAQTEAHGQHIANNTGATVMIPKLFEQESVHFETLQQKYQKNGFAKYMDDINTLIREFHKDPKHSKVGLCGFGLGGALAMEVAADVSKENWIHGLVTINGLPFQLTQEHYLIPTRMPVQAHFSNIHSAKHFFHLDQIQPLKKEWDHAIQRFGGIHSKGFHSMEEHIFFYQTESGFMDDQLHLNPGKYSRDEANVCWQRLFEFFKHHLKVL